MRKIPNTTNIFIVILVVVVNVAVAEIQFPCVIIVGTILRTALTAVSLSDKRDFFYLSVIPGKRHFSPATIKSIVLDSGETAAFTKKSCSLCITVIIQILAV